MARPKAMKMEVSPTDVEDVGLMAVDVRVRVVFGEVPVSVGIHDVPYDVAELSEYIGLRSRRGIAASLNTAYEEFIEGTTPLRCNFHEYESDITDAMGEEIRAPMSIRVDSTDEPDPSLIKQVVASVALIYPGLRCEFNQDDLRWTFIDAQGRKVVQISAADDYREIIDIAWLNDG